MTKLLLIACTLGLASASFAALSEGQKMSADAKKIYKAVKRVSRENGRDMVFWNTDFNELEKLDCADGGWSAIGCNAKIVGACLDLDGFIEGLKLSTATCTEYRAAMELCLLDPYLVPQHVDNTARYRAYYAVSLKRAGCKL